MDMTVTVPAPFSRDWAETVCRMVFGEDPAHGPQVSAPEELLAVLKDWPGPTDQPITVALQLPQRFDIERDMGKGQVKAVTLVLNRITVLHRGETVGYGLRADQAGINAIDLHARAWAAFKARLRQAH